MATIPGCCGINRINNRIHPLYQSCAVNVYFSTDAKDGKHLKERGFAVAAELDGVTLYSIKTDPVLEYEKTGGYHNDDDDDDDYDDDYEDDDDDDDF